MSSVVHQLTSMAGSELQESGVALTRDALNRLDAYLCHYFKESSNVLISIERVVTQSEYLDFLLEPVHF